MKTFLKTVGAALSISLFAGCASMNGVDGPGGPRLVSNGYSTQNGSYAEVGVSFSTTGDFVAIINPNRWKSPIKTGGSLSWINPVAWSDDAGRTGRILLGEAVVVGGVAAAAMAGGSDDGGSSSPTPPGGNPGGPPTL